MSGQLIKRLRLFSSVRRSLFIKQSLKYSTSPLIISSNKKLTLCNNSTKIQKLKYLHTSNIHKKRVEFLLADIGEGIKEVVLKQWYVKEGDKIAQFDNVCEVQSDKASVTITSRYDGIVQKLHCDVEEIALVGKSLMEIEVEKDESQATVGDEVLEGEAIPMGKAGGSSGGAGEDTGRIELPLGMSKVLTTPAVRRLSMEYKVDLSKVSATGRDGRILKEDVLNYIQKGTKAASAAANTTISQPAPRPTAIKPSPPSGSPAAVASPQTPLPVPLIAQQDRTEPIKGYKKIMVKTMTAAMRIPHFGYSDEVDMSALMRLKKQLSAAFEEHGLKFTFMPLFVKALSLSLLHFPALNASLNDDCDKITYKASHNIGVAMDTAEGLIVPNVKAVQGRSLLELGTEISRLQACGQRGSFSTTDVTGGTFTLSNIGSIGGTGAQPLILAPEIVICALGRARRLPRFEGNSDRVVESHVMPIDWSADHRVVDGATMARFSNRFKGYLEKPVTMITYMK